jgi:hypothetical protein
MVDVSVGSWHHLVEHDGIQENEAASNQECQIINSELLAASEAKSKLGRHCFPVPGYFPSLQGDNFVVVEQCLYSQVKSSQVKSIQDYCETAVAAGQAHVHRMVYASFEETLQPFLDTRILGD